MPWQPPETLWNPGAKFCTTKPTYYSENVYSIVFKLPRMTTEKIKQM